MKRYNPAKVAEWREAAKRGESLIRPVDLSRIAYACRKCGVEYMGGESHKCAL
jgi:hypothetical protein